MAGTVDDSTINIVVVIIIIILPPRGGATDDPNLPAASRLVRYGKDTVMVNGHYFRYLPSLGA